MSQVSCWVWPFFVNQRNACSYWFHQVVSFNRRAQLYTTSLDCSAGASKPFSSCWGPMGSNSRRNACRSCDGVPRLITSLHNLHGNPASFVSWKSNTRQEASGRFRCVFAGVCKNRELVSRLVVLQVIACFGSAPKKLKTALLVACAFVCLLACLFV